MNNIYFNYLKSLLKHKWFVFVGCFRLAFHFSFLFPGILFRGIIHDWSKFSFTEFPRYARKFGKTGINTGRDKSRILRSSER